MAVTLEGVFRIIDRASPAMRGMERQALKTDAAIASLGVTLDALGSNQQLKKLDSTTRNVRTLGLEGDNAGKRLRGAGNEVEMMGNKVDTMGRKVERAGLKLGAFSKLLAPAKFLALGAGIGVLVQAVGALSGGVISLIPRLTDLVGLAAPAIAGFTGLGVAAIATKLAISGLSKAYSGNKAALKQLTPEGRAFLAQLKAMRPVLKDLRQSAQQGLFPGLSRSLTSVRRAAPSLRGIVRGGGAAVGNAASRITGSLTSSSSLSDLGILSGQGFQMIGRGTTALLSLIDVLRNLGVAAVPFTDWLTKSIVLWAQHRAAISEFNRDSGKTAAFLDRTKVALMGTVHFVESLWANLRLLGQAARPLGDILWGSANRGLAGWTKLHSTVAGREGLTREFLAMAPAVQGILKLFSDLGAAIFRMGSSQGLPSTVSALDKLVPSLEKTLNFLANTFGPPLANMLSSIGNLATSLTGVAGPFTLMADLLSKTFDLIADISNAVPGMGKVFGTALDVFLIQRFLVKLGLLQRGWLGVAGAARTAAAAEAEATGLGAVGAGGGGFFGRLRGRAGGARSNLGTGFSLAREGESAGEIGSLGRMAGLGGLLGAGRLGGVLAGASRFAGPAGLIAGGAGLALNFLPVSNRTKSIGTDVAMGAGIGSFIGPEGTALGALAGGAFGLLHSQGGSGDLRTDAVTGEINTQLSGISGFTTQIGRLTAEIAIYQSAQRQLQGDNSKAAQAELASIQQEIAARRSVVNQLKAERTQRQNASRAKQAMNIATDLGHLFDALVKQGHSKADALRIVNADANTRIPGLRGIAKTGLASGMLKFNQQITSNDPAAKSVMNAERKWIAANVAGIFGVGSNLHKFTAGPGDLSAINKKLRAQHFTESNKEATQLSRTALQNAEYRWFIANGVPPDRAAAMVQSTDGTATAPKIAPSTSAAARSQAGDLLALRNLPPALRKIVLAEMMAGSNPAHKHAAGGRISGGGLTDSVGVAPGAMAAPGELIVNRHQEAMADRGLGGRGRLAGIVRGMPVKHSAAMMRGFASGGRYGYPLGRTGQLIGTPYAGTHGKAFNIAGGSDNWESENAIDIGTPTGTRVLATAGGTIGSQIGSLGSGGRFAGLRLHLVTDGNEFYYAHLSSLDVHAGERVKAGQLLGLSGAANGVSHLHIAEMNGNPMGLVGASVRSGQAGLGKATAGTGGAAGRVGAGVASAGLTALAFAGNPFAQGQEALRATAAAAIMGFVPVTGAAGGGVANVAGASRAKRRGTGANISGGGPVAAGSLKALGRQMMLQRWGSGQWGALDSLWTGESHWDPSVRNTSSNAQGIPQFLPMPGRTMPPGFPDSPPISARSQIGWGLDYIQGRYGSPSNAYSAWLGRSPHWYQGGGRIPYAGAFEKGGQFRTNGPTAFIAGDGASPRETVTVSRGHGAGGASLVIQHLEINAANAADRAGLKRVVTEAIEEAWGQLERELEREAARA